ncbi:MAG: tryptophan synthase subunit alpha, partial [Bdellovibrionales bacterium]|nr:tryptophan synthase subunit alpha [Bdellovibrionales bacterium]
MNNSLEKFIRHERERKEILLMAHLVLGYPSLESNFKTVAALVSAGVELIELQFPHSEPMADGPVIAQANQISLSRGISIDNCFRFAEEVTSKYPSTKFLAMTYLNIVFKRTFESFCKEAVSAGLSGLIVADLTIETSSDLETHCKNQGLS